MPQTQEAPPVTGIAQDWRDEYAYTARPGRACARAALSSYPDIPRRCSSRSDQLKLAGPADRFAAVGRGQLAVDALEVGLHGVDGDVHLAGDLGGAEQA